MLKVAGKSSSNISKEKNKKQLFENSEDNNKDFIKNVRIRKGSGSSKRSKASYNIVGVPRQEPLRRSFSSQGSRSSSSYNRAMKENALRNSQALLGNSTYQGPPYAYKTRARPQTVRGKDKFGSQYGNLFDYENSLYATKGLNNKKFSQMKSFKKRMTGNRVTAF